MAIPRSARDDARVLTSPAFSDPTLWEWLFVHRRAVAR